MIYFEKIIDLVAWLSAWLFCIAGFMLSYEVVARYFFLAPTSWAAELSQLSLIIWYLISYALGIKVKKTYSNKFSNQQIIQDLIKK